MYLHHEVVKLRSDGYTQWQLGAGLRTLQTHDVHGACALAENEHSNVNRQRLTSLQQLNVTVNALRQSIPAAAIRLPRSGLELVLGHIDHEFELDRLLAFLTVVEVKISCSKAQRVRDRSGTQEPTRQR